MSRKCICCNVIGCGYIAVDRVDFQMHMLTHQHTVYTQKLERRQCCTAPGCNYVTSNMCLAKAHSLTHVREKPYQCIAPGCGYTAWKSQSLDKHMKTHMGTESSRATSHKLAEQSVDEQQGGDYSQDESIFKCAISGCNYESRVGTEFEAHMWTHTMAIYECKVRDCHCELSSLDLLNSHMLLHCGMFLLQCEVPGCRFVGKQTRYSSSTCMSMQTLCTIFAMHLVAAIQQCGKDILDSTCVFIQMQRVIGAMYQAVVTSLGSWAT